MKTSGLIAALVTLLATEGDLEVRVLQDREPVSAIRSVGG